MKQSTIKVKSLAEIEKIARRARANKQKIVTTNGAFDLIHIGHVRNLQKAKSLGDILIVGVNSDRSVRTHKDASRPIMPERERAEVIAGLQSVDYVFIFKTPNPIPWLGRVKPDIHVKGADRVLREIPERAIVEKYGGCMVLVPYTRGNSTTAIIGKVLKTQLHRTAGLL